MIVYRASYGWFDSFEHIGIFEDQISAWIACYKYYKENICREMCWKCYPKYCDCKTPRLTSSRYTRFSIDKEEVKRLKNMGGCSDK